MASRHSYRSLSPAEVETMMRLAREFHREKRPLPPDIVELKKKIEGATRNAELFQVRLRVIDEGMLREIVAMKFNLDQLYAEWVAQETSTLQ